MDRVDVIVHECSMCADPPVVVVDTYAVTRQYVKMLSEVARVCYMGILTCDLGELSMLINYATNYDADLYDAIYGSRGTRLLLGTRYTPLAAAFSKQPKRFRGKIKHVLVTTGSTDPAGFTPSFLRRALETAELDDVYFEVVVGGLSDDMEEVRSLAFSGERVRVRRDVKNMASLMRSCDAAISANGTTVYELAAVGVASVVFSISEEQIGSANSLADLGAIEYAGAIPQKGLDAVIGEAIALLTKLVKNPGRAEELAKKAHSLVDGNGARRIAKEIALL